MKKLNIGCGSSVHNDWINIDNSLNAKLSKYPYFKYLLYKIGILPEDFYNVKWPKNILICNVKKGLPYQDNEVDFIFSSHFIEHLKKDEAEMFLKECLRVLKPRGLIRITTPDLRILVKKYEDSFGEKNISAAEDLLRDINSDEEGKKRIIDLIYSGGKHWMVYDEHSLSNLLKSTGFTKIKKKRFQEGEMPDIDFLDNRPNESLYMEAKK
jgi:predicted SAM-dependent methyltransferase